MLFTVLHGSFEITLIIMVMTKFFISNPHFALSSIHMYDTNTGLTEVNSSFSPLTPQSSIELMQV